MRSVSFKASSIFYSLGKCLTASVIDKLADNYLIIIGI